MSAKIRAPFSGAILFLLSLLSLLLALVALSVGMTLGGRLDSANFDVAPAPVVYARESLRTARVSPMRGGAYSKAEFEDFAKKLAVEYITMRYTVNGSAYLMDRALGIYSDGGGVPMKILSADAAYAKFRDDEAPGVIALMNTGTTRSVKIIEGPYRRATDRWVTKVEFIYREPTTESFESARREYWDIHMEVAEAAKFRQMSSNIYRFPATMFGFRVNWLGKYESRR